MEALNTEKYKDMFLVLKVNTIETTEHFFYVNGQIHLANVYHFQNKSKYLSKYQSWKTEFRNVKYVKIHLN